MKVAERRLRNKLSKLIGRRRAITRRLTEIDDALAELGQLGGAEVTEPQTVRGLNVRAVCVSAGCDGARKPSTTLPDTER
jgi:hypothetical protein